MKLRVVVLVLMGGLAAGCGEGGSVVTDQPDVAGTDLVTPDTAPEDVQSPDTQEADVATEDVAPEDIAPSCDEGEGCFGESCASPDDCLSGICTLHLGDKVCSKTCDEACPQGFTCTLVGSGGDGQYVCLSNASHLCLPCLDSSSCSGESPNACVLYADGMSFCGSSCDVETTCPEGTECQLVKTTEGADSYQCVAESGMCECSNTAIDAAMATPCSLENDEGTCTGVRICQDTGLSECSATEPNEEICNGIDDNCDGTIDVGTCDDGNGCTIDTCAGEAGCQHEPLNEGECLDGDACTIGDHCEDGVCVGTPIDCEDGNPCTVDSCDGLGGCKSENITAVCDDDDPCTVGDLCQDGTCQGSATLTCDDGNPCTDDSCGDGGCIYKPNALDCDDGNACTEGDLCAQGTCQGTDAICDDANLCTTDSCAVQTGCVYSANTQPCDDGNVCTLGDTCGDGSCGAGATTLTCSDGNPCTDDTCDETLGCVFSPNTLECDDSNNCTTADACVEGACVGSGSLACDDGNPCTVDSCLPNGGCSYTNSQNICDDGDACTLGDACSDGACVSGTVLSCDDGNPCTDEACDGGDCVFTPNDAPCDDANACTPASTCSAGACVGAGMLDCDDDLVCTSDACDPATGCTHGNNQAPCDDGDLCTLGDACSGGSCVGGAQTLPCDDGNPCTDDACDGASGCTFQANALPCDDGNACTANDICQNKSCLGPEAVDCSDDDGCTDESCDPIQGCQTTFNNAACDDGDACTIGDTCANGACAPGQGTLPCNDGLFCNGEESCDPAQGCSDGAAPQVDDGIDCTVDVCDNDQGKVLHTPNSNLCPQDPNATCQVAVCDAALGCTTEVIADCCGNGIVEAGEDCDDDEGCPDTCQVSASCKALFDGGEAQSGVYTIDPDGAGGNAPFDVYCDMVNHGGGWTLVLMTQSDDHEILKYESELWSNDDTYNPDIVDPDTNTTMKSQAYGTVAFSRVRFDLVSIANSHFVDVTKSSAKELLNGAHVDAPYGRGDYLAWVPESPSEWDNQPCCNLKGVQVNHQDVARCRYGILMNNECHECHSADAAVGFGCFTNANDAPQVRRISAGAFRWQPDIRYNHRGWIWVR